MFKIHKMERAGDIPFEYLPASAITPKIGLALKITSGKLAVCSGTTKPAYICMCEKDSAVTAGDIIPVIRVEPETIFETQASVALTDIAIGNKLTISSDGDMVTATTSSGVAEVVAMDGKAQGDTVYVRFS